MTDTPADKVRNTIADYISDELCNAVTTSYRLHGLSSDYDEDDEDPFAPLIVKDSEGRRFEIEFEVLVTELTEKVLRDRAEFVERMQNLQKDAR